MEERNVKISLDKAREWYNRGGELKEIALSAFTENEITTSTLPNTWKEFCEMYPVKEREHYIEPNSKIVVKSYGSRFNEIDRNLLPSKQAAEQHLALMQLHQLRDCYRQGWIPDWNDACQTKWAIFRVKNEWKIEPIAFSSRFLSFQSKEIAEKFFNNFKDLIETAGDLI